MPHRPFTPRQQRQNEAFLAALRRTGNVRLACRELGVNRSTYTKRRARCAAFATNWDMTLAAAHAAFQLAGGERLPLPAAKRRAGVGAGLRTEGGEPMVTSQADGRLQLRLAPPGRMTAAAEQRFLGAVEETNNIRLAAAEAGGFAHTSLLARARRSPALAASLATARRIGADRVLWEIMHPPGRADPAAAEFACLPMPAMTVEQAMLQLIYHRPGGRFQHNRWTRRAPPVPFEQVKPRIIARLNAWQRAEWHRETGTWVYPDEESDAPGER